MGHDWQQAAHDHAAVHDSSDQQHMANVKWQHMHGNRQAAAQDGQAQA
jgi:hypothetical protein